MKLYIIRDWNTIFENNRSRTVEDLRWVAIPNRHDGENYAAMITHKDGAEMFAAWCLCVQVASRCRPRGSLLRGGKIPHDPASLCTKTRAPQIWFKKLFDFLEKYSDWLVITDVTVDCQAGGTRLSGDCQAGDEGGKDGKEGRKGANSAAAAVLFPDNLQTDEFSKAWADWRQDRKDRKCQMTKKAEEIGLKKCSEWGASKSTSLIYLAIEKGWKGLYEPNVFNGGKNNPVEKSDPAVFMTHWTKDKAPRREQFESDSIFDTYFEGWKKHFKIA